MPADARGVLFIAASGVESESADALDGMQVKRVAPGPPTDIEVTRERVPEGWLIVIPWREGERYEIQVADPCPIGGTEPLRATVSVGPELAATSLGALDAEPLRGALSIADARASCSRSIDVAGVEIELRPDEAFAGALPGLLFETRVDGEPYGPSASEAVDTPPGASWAGRGRDRVVTSCAERDVSAGDAEGAAELLAPGVHRVQLRARLPGDERIFETTPLEVTLSCPVDDAPGGSRAGTGRAPEADADEAYRRIAFPIWAMVIAGQFALLLFYLLARKRRRRR